jgi:hypothetical protein
MDRSRQLSAAFRGMIALTFVLIGCGVAAGPIPGVGGTPKASPAPPISGSAPAATKENPDSTVAAPTGPISLEK